MIDTAKKNIFFHVGTGKTGSTFLQHQVFPKLKGIYYIKNTRYKRINEIIEATNFTKYLVSSEFDQQLEIEVKSFSSKFPQTKPIIVFRRHDSYIASQYKRFVKNGFTGGFLDFFDLENDQGYFKKHDLDYCSQIQILEKYFDHKPFVLFHQDLKIDTPGFIKKLTKLLDVSINYQQLNTKKRHVSYSEKQLKAMLFLGKYINMRKRRIFKNGLLHFFWKLYLGSIRYSTLYIAKCIPEAFFGSQTLIPKNELEKVRKYYRNDWEQCLVYPGKQTKIPLIKNKEQ
jgi:hypothetical protein